MDRQKKAKFGKKMHNCTWERNHALLTKAYLEHIKEYKTTPTLKQLNEKTGISLPKISAHLKELDIDRLTIGSPHRLIGDIILMGLGANGAQGDSAAAKLFFQLVFGFSEKASVDHTSGGKEIKSLTSEQIFDRISEIVLKAKQAQEDEK